MTPEFAKTFAARGEKDINAVVDEVVKAVRRNPSGK